MSATFLRALHDQRVSDLIGKNFKLDNRVLRLHWRMRALFWKRSYLGPHPVPKFWSFPRT